MSDITITPIPYNSGTMQITTHAVHYCDMGNGKFLHVIAQTGPNYVFAYVSNFANLKTGTFSDVNATMRALLTPSTPVPAPSTTAVLRLWKLNTTQALFMLNRTLYVLEIQANNDIVMKNATIANFNNNTLPTLGTVNNYGILQPGMALTGWYIRDNTVWFANRGNNTTGNATVTLQKVTYDGTADTLTATTLTTATIASGTPATIFIHPILQTIPGSTKRFFYLRAVASNSSPLANAPPVYATMIDSITDVVTASPVISGMNSAVRCLAPLSETLVLGLTDTRSYYTNTSGTWNTTIAYFGANQGSNPMSIVEAIDANYMMIITLNASVSADIAVSANFFVKIVRYVDPTFGQTSSSTISQDGAGFAIGGIVFPDLPFLTKNGTDSFVNYGRSNTSTAFNPAIKVIYQPGA